MANKALGSILNDIGAGAVYEGAAGSAGAAGGPLAAANAIRYVTNSLDPNPQIQDQQHASGMAWIPTQAAARLGQRRAVLSNVIGSQNKWKPLHQSLGGLTTLGASGLLGALFGLLAARGKDQKTATRYAGIGGLAGIGVHAGASVLGSLLAAITAKRSLQQQKDYEESGAATAANYLIPGASSYNHWKSVGTMLGDQYQKAREKGVKKKGVSKKAGLQKISGTQEWWSHEGAGKGVKIGGITGATIAGVPAVARWTLLRGANPVLKLLGGLINGTIAAGAGALGGGIIGGAAGGLFGPKKKKRLQKL